MDKQKIPLLFLSMGYIHSTCSLKFEYFSSVYMYPNGLALYVYDAVFYAEYLLGFAESPSSLNFQPSKFFPLKSSIVRGRVPERVRRNLQQQYCRYDELFHAIAFFRSF